MIGFKWKNMEIRKIKQDEIPLKKQKKKIASSLTRICRKTCKPKNKIEKEKEEPHHTFALEFHVGS